MSIGNTDSHPSGIQVQLDDFDDVARQYAERMGQERNRKVKWYDLYGENPELKNHPEYKKYKIDIHTDSIKYGIVTRQVDRPGYVYEQDYENSSSSGTVEGIIEHTHQETTSMTWNLEAGIKIGTSVTASAGVPAVFGGSVTVNTELSLKYGQAETTTDSVKYSVSSKIPVPPKTKVRAVWTITDREVEIPWEADVYIDGYIAIWFEDKWEGHWLWFHPIQRLASGHFERYGSGLRFRAKGNFKGVRGLYGQLVVNDYPLPKKSNAVEDDDEPTRVSLLERKEASPFKHGIFDD